MQEEKKPTMQDVARRAGTSKTTVSRVLRGIPGAASEQTTRRILEAADDLNYVVNIVAANLKKGRSNIVGLVIPDPADAFFSFVTAGVEAALHDAGYIPVLAHTSRELSIEVRATATLLEHQVEGLIVASSCSNCKHLETAIARGVEVVAVESIIPGIECDSVTASSFTASRDAVAHLLELGHKRIAIITGPLSVSSDRQRFEGYLAAQHSAGLTVDDDLHVASDFSDEGGRTAISRLLNLDSRPTSVLVANSTMTLAALTVIFSAGLRIPEDISIIGWDDLTSYPFCNPPVSAIFQPGYAMGVAATKCLVRRLRQKRRPQPQHIELPAELRLRASTGPAPQITKTLPFRRD